jgi:DNA-binding FrmR family transcriptional regulator
MEKEPHKLPSDLILDIITRLKTLSGQINGIVKMLDEGKDPEQINIQFKSIDKGIQKAHYLLLDEVYRKTLAIGIVKAVDSCPGNCGNEDKIDYLKNEFPNLKLGDLTDKLKEIQTIETRLMHYNEKKGKNIWLPPASCSHICAIINLNFLNIKKQLQLLL